MAALDAFAYVPSTYAVCLLLDVALGWDIAVNPVCGYAIAATYKPHPKREDWKLVSGVTLDASNNPAARKVRVEDRATGGVLGSTVSNADTGIYVIAVPVSSEVTVVALDDDAGAVYNDLILRTTPV